MKSLLTALSVLTIGTTAGNLINVLNNEIKFKENCNNLPIKNDGINLISEGYSKEYNHSYFVYIKSSTINKWTKTSKEKLNSVVTNDLTFFLLDKGFNKDKFILEKNLNKIAQLTIDNFDKIIKIRGATSEYGVKITYEESQIWAKYYSYLETISQYSPNIHDASIVEKYYQFLAHDQLKVGISQYDWQRILTTNKNENKILNIISDFPQWDSSLFVPLSNDDLHILVKTIINNFDEISNLFKVNNIGWKLVTNTEGDWEGFEFE